jgi:hypothetical protein
MGRVVPCRRDDGFEGVPLADMEENNCKWDGQVRILVNPHAQL